MTHSKDRDNRGCAQYTSHANDRACLVQRRWHLLELYPHPKIKVWLD